ncbi:MAG: hypothetical protein M1818_004760, partial [Claussenomyces sp. TS43310]
AQTPLSNFKMVNFRALSVLAVHLARLAAAVPTPVADQKTSEYHLVTKVLRGDAIKEGLYGMQRSAPGLRLWLTRE